MRIVGFVLAIAILFVGIGSNGAAMADPPSAIIVLGFVLGALLMSGADIPLMFRGIRSGTLAEADAARAAGGWRRVRLFALAGGGLGTVIGWVIMLKNIDDPAAIGPGMAISLLTVLYGLILAFMIALPLQVALQDPKEDASIGSSAVFAILLSAFVSIGSFAVLSMSFA